MGHVGLVGTLLIVPLSTGIAFLTSRAIAGRIVGAYGLGVLSPNPVLVGDRRMPARTAASTSGGAASRATAASCSFRSTSSPVFVLAAEAIAFREVLLQQEGKGESV